jgi:hypothetical protein
LPTLESIAFDEAVRALDKQEKVLEELRARTGLLLAASSLAASLFGRAAFDDLNPVAIGVIALLAFLISLGASLSVLLPRSSFVFSLGGTAVYEGLYEFGDDIDEVHRRLTYDLQRFWDDNDTRLKPLINGFRVAAIALGVEVLALALLVSGRIG